MNNLKKLLIPLFFVETVLLLTLLSVESNAAVRFKIATLAPEGTTWMAVMKEMAREVENKTDGEVKIKFYPGGVMGDEGDVIRKMRFGQIHGGGFTGRGLGEILPSERVLELPSLFNNYGEVDCVKKLIQQQLSDDFEKKGFVHLGWAEAGFVYLFTNKPIYKASDLKGVKMWMWEGDPLARSLFKANRIVPVPLDLPNVLTAMQTGLINAVYSTPYALVALQWHTRVKYMVKMKLTYASGAILVSKKQFDKASPQNRMIFRKAVKKYTKKLERLTRQENEHAISVLKKSGIKIIDLKRDVAKIERNSQMVYQKMVGKLYPKALLEKVLEYTHRCRDSSK